MDGRKIASNVFYYSLDFITLTAFGYVFWILMGKMLPPEQYGILFSIVSIFYILIAVATLGMYEALPKFISENKEKSGSVIRFSMKLSLAISFLISAFIYIFSSSISEYFYGSLIMAQPLQFMSFILFFGAIFYITKSILQGLQDFKHMFYGEIFSNVIKIISAVLLVSAGFSVLGGAISWVLWFLAASVIFSWFILKRISGTSNFDKKRFLHYSFLSMTSLISFFVIFQSGIILLGAMSSMTAAALMGVAFLFGELVMMLPSVVMGSIYPSLAELWPRQKEKFTRLLSMTIKFVILITTPIMLLFITFAKDIINIFYTSEYVQASILFPTFLFGSFLAGLNTILFIALYTANRPKARTCIMLIGTVIAVVLTVLLIPYFDSLGASIAFLTAQIIMMIGSLILLVKMMKFHISKRTLLMIPITAVFLLLLVLSNASESIIIKILGITISSIFYLWSVFFFKIISKEELSMIKIHGGPIFKLRKRLKL